MTTTDLTLAALLNASIFYHTDTARSTDSYVYQEILVSYNEPDNVTCAGCGWRVGGFTRLTRNWPYLWQRQNTSAGELVHPPMGIRSAPALGGLGAGSVELRADGSFRDWTIFNQGPAGSGKFGLVDDAFMAVRLGGTARVLRTHAPLSLGGVAQPTAALAFSGSYPLTRLAIDDQGLVPATADAALYGYSTLRPTQPEASAAPALVLTLRIANNGAAPLPVDFMFSLPLGAWTDCSRQGKSGVRVPNATTVADCMRGCGAGCASWEFERGSGACVHNPDVPLTAHRVGSSCGVKGGWSRGAPPSLRWTQRPAGVAAGPSLGDVTLLPVTAGEGEGAGEGAREGDRAARASVGVADDPAVLYRRFAATGSVGEAGRGPAAQGAQGGVALSATVAPGASTTLSIVFAWHFPDRDYDGEIVGNHYAHLYRDSAAVADALGTEAALSAVVSDLNTHHSTIASRESPYPAWLKDMLLNQASCLPSPPPSPPPPPPPAPSLPPLVPVEPPAHAAVAARRQDARVRCVQL